MATSAQMRQQLVEALQLDLVGPGWDDVARRHERLPQPPSIWYTTGFLVPNTFQEEAGRPPEGDAPSFADQAGEDPSNDAAIRQEEREGDDDANGSQEESSSKRNWFPSSAGLSLIVEQGSRIEVTITWGDYEPPEKGSDDKGWSRTPRREVRPLTIDKLGPSPDIRLLLIHRLREVQALVGFTRFTPRTSSLGGLPIQSAKANRRAALATNPSWVPASENKGEGLFLEFEPATIEAWIASDPVQQRCSQFIEAFAHDWLQSRGLTTANFPFPGPASLLLHSLSHLLITERALDCGYGASSIRERIDARPLDPTQTGSNRYGILLFTSSSGSEGTPYRRSASGSTERCGPGLPSPWPTWIAVWWIVLRRAAINKHAKALIVDAGTPKGKALITSANFSETAQRHNTGLAAAAGLRQIGGLRRAPWKPRSAPGSPRSLYSPPRASRTASRPCAPFSSRRPWCCIWGRCRRRRPSARSISSPVASMPWMASRSGWATPCFCLRRLWCRSNAMRRSPMPVEALLQGPRLRRPGCGPRNRCRCGGAPLPLGRSRRYPGNHHKGASGMARKQLQDGVFAARSGPGSGCERVVQQPLTGPC